MSENDKIIEQLSSENRKLRARISELEGLGYELRMAQFALDTVGACIYWIRSDCTLAYVNKTACENLGYERSELAGQGLSIIDPDFQPDHACDFWRRITQSGDVVLESRHRTKTGRIFPVKIRAYTLQNDSQEYVFVIAQDVSDQKRARNVLVKNEALLRDAQRLAHIGSFFHDLERDATSWSEELYHIYGLNPAEAPPSEKRHRELMLKGEWEHQRRLFEETMGSGDQYQLEYRIRRTDGVVRVLHCIAHWFRDQDGRPNALAGTVQDITDRIVAEERFGRVVEGCPMGIYLYELSAENELIMTGANSAADEIIGFSHTSMVGKRIEQAFPQLAKTHLPQRFRQIAEEGQSAHFDRVSYEDEHIRGIFDVYAFQTAPRSLAVMFVDITEREHLGARLLHSEKMEAIGQLAGGVAHDFNNQLAAILGYADLMAAEAPDPAIREDAERILTAARRSADLTKQLLAFSRRGQYQNVPVDIHETISEVVSILKRSVDKRIHIRQHLEAVNPATTGDPTQLQNALLNVMLNARDAMPDGGDIIIRTDTTVLDQEFCNEQPYEIEPGKYLVVFIADTGVGMPPETLGHIFEPFFTTKAKSKGTGMGLAAVYGTVKTHRGAITVHSRVGHGSNFTIYLPLSEVEIPSASPENSPAVAKDSEHILVVDDEEGVRRIATQMLKRLGYQVTVCRNGREAVEFYRDSWAYIDLVILDMIMPEINGKDAFVALRGINPDAKILLSSGYTLDGDAQKTLEDGAVDFIPKPYDMQTLGNKVHAVLRARVGTQG